MMITDRKLRSELAGIVLRLIETRRTVSYMQIRMALRDRQLYPEFTIDEINEYLEKLEKLRYFPMIYRKIIANYTTIDGGKTRNIIYSCPTNTGIDEFVNTLKHSFDDDVRIVEVNRNE